MERKDPLFLIADIRYTVCGEIKVTVKSYGQEFSSSEHEIRTINDEKNGYPHYIETILISI